MSEAKTTMFVFAGNNGCGKSTIRNLIIDRIGGDPNLNIERVAVRVRNGGHHIPSKDILHRHHSSIQNLLNHLDLVNYVVDNSALNGEIVLEADNGKLTCHDLAYSKPIRFAITRVILRSRYGSSYSFSMRNVRSLANSCTFDPVTNI
jgi:predicted ABC-type ATPase